MIPFGKNRKKNVLNNVHRDKKRPYELKHATITKNGSMFYDIEKIKEITRRINKC